MSLFGETGVTVLIEFTTLKFWHRAISMNGDRLTRRIYDWNKSLADKGIKNWAK